MTDRPNPDTLSLVERLKSRAAYDRLHYPPADPLYMEAAQALLSAEKREAELLAAMKELDAVLGETPMPDCAAMNRLIAARAKARSLSGEGT